MTPKYTDFATLAAHYGGRAAEPYEGEEAGDPCPQCGRRARYTQDDKGRWRLQMQHGAHRAKPTESSDAPDIVPPRRTGDAYDYTDYLNDD